MNNNFNLERFGKYFVYDLKRQCKNIGMLTLIFALFPIIFYMLYMFFAALFDGGLVSIFTGGAITGPQQWVRFSIFGCMISVFVMLYPSRAYGEITDKAKGSEWLMLPASRLEKFTSMTLNTLIVIPLVFIIVYLFSDSLVCLFDKSCGDPLISFRINEVIGSDALSFPANGLWILAANVIVSASVFLLGGLIFKKWKVIGTLLVLFAIGMIWSLALSVFITNADLEVLGNQIVDWIQRHADNIDLWLNGFMNAYIWIVVAICMVASWFRLKRLQH